MDFRSVPPRVVVVTRPSELELLVARHGTKEQARFFLKERGQSIEPVEAAHAQLLDAVHVVLAALPLSYRRAKVGREDLSRFLFEPGDIVVPVGQDGLVANVAKYLDGQPVVGVAPGAPTVLVRCAPRAFADVLRATTAGRATLEARTMVEARLDDGQVLRSLNEIFVGHRSHQSARYALEVKGRGREQQSSSGVVVSSGTGATGWAASLARAAKADVALPAPTDAQLVYFVREAWPSPSTGTTLTRGTVEPNGPLVVHSEMNEGGVVFGDGMESDRLLFGWGQRVTIGPSGRRLMLALG